MKNDCYQLHLARAQRLSYTMPVLGGIRSRSQEDAIQAKVFVAALPLLFSVGCTARQSEELTQRQKDQIKSEVKTVGDSLMASDVTPFVAPAIHTDRGC